MRRRTILLIIVFLIVIVGAGGANWFRAVLGPYSIETVIRDMNFRPQHPPNTLYDSYNPGALYLVNAFGKVTPICDTSNIQRQWSEGHTEERVIRVFSVAESHVRTASVEAMGGGTSKTKIELILRDAIVREADLAKLSLINETLQKRPLCAKTLEKALEEGRCVAQSQAILIATLDVRSRARVALSGEGRELATSMAINGRVARDEIRIGDRLHYGLRLTDRCMTTTKRKHPLHVPDEIWWFFKTGVNLFYTSLENVGL